MLQYVFVSCHPHTSFFLLLLLDGDALSEEKQINPWELETINLWKTQIHLLYSERAKRNEAYCAPHADWKRIITYYSFLDPWRTSEASLILHCSFLVPINRKHALIRSHKETQQYCCGHKLFRLLWGYREDLRVLQWWGALWGRSWSYCPDDDGEIGHMPLLWHKSIWKKPLCALLLIEKYA